MIALSIAAASKETGLGRTSIYKAVAAGELRSLLVGSRRLLLVTDLTEWLTAQRVPNPNEQTKNGAVLALGRKHTTPSRS